jgi:hypothetical protein
MHAFEVPAAGVIYQLWSVICHVHGNHFVLFTRIKNNPGWYHYDGMGVVQKPVNNHGICTSVIGHPRGHADAKVVSQIIYIRREKGWTPSTHQIGH